MIMNMMSSGGKLSASGTGNVTGGSTTTFKNLAGVDSNVNAAKVTQNLGFVPSLIIVTVKGAEDVTTIYRAEGWTTDSKSKIKGQDGMYYQLTGNAKVTATGFTLPLHFYDDGTFNWVAYE